MEEMKGKMKGFMKKVNSFSSSSSSSSGKFKGQGRVLGSSSSSGPSNPTLPRPNPHYLKSNSNSNPNPTPKPSSSSASSSALPRKPLASDDNRSASVNLPASNRKPADGFDPYDSLITTGKRSQNGFSVNVFECPICGRGFRTEDEVSQHVESCVNSSNNQNSIDSTDASVVGDSRSEMEIRVSAFLSGSPKEGSVEVVRTLLRNVVREPENGKFRRIRMSNPRIREAIGEVAGGVELLESVGFELREEGGEMWAVMEVPDEKRISLITKVIELLGPIKAKEPLKVENSNGSPAANVECTEPEKFDRQV